MKLTKNYFDEYLKVRQLYLGAEENIQNRITEVLKVIALCFRKTPLNSWWFPNAPEGGCGYLMGEHASIPETVCFETRDGHIFDTKYEKGWDYSYEFPIEFLFMEDEEIRKQILNEIELGKQERETKKAKELLAKEKKKSLAEQAKSKLTKEERKALGI